MIENFRQAAGISNVYRSATTDVLGELDVTKTSQLETTEKFVVEQPGLILDLRSRNEINEPLAQKWMANATLQGIKLVESESIHSYDATERRRAVVRVNVLSMPRLMAFVDNEWLNPIEKQKAAELKKTGSSQEQIKLRIEKLNQHGLFGLNQLILESGDSELCKALMMITQRLEANPHDIILIHCVQGKDRTGMLVMLLQSILELADDVIIEDYFASDNNIISLSFGSAAAAVAFGKRQHGKLDRTLFSRATREAMVSTLEYMRQKYGSISPGYLNHIGFTDYWRRRIHCRLNVSHRSPKSRL